MELTGTTQTATAYRVLYFCNYAFCIGDTNNNALNIADSRGVFGSQRYTKLAGLTDGTSNTITFSERLKANFGITNVVANQIETTLGTATRVPNILTVPAACYNTANGRYFNAGQLVKGRFGSLWTDGQSNYGVELAIVGLVLGLAFGLLAGSPKRLLAAIMGGLGGALAGAASGFFGGRIVANSLFQNQQQTLQASMGLQALVWGVIIASVVWFVAVVNVGLIRSIQHGLVGLIAGGVVAVAQFVISSFMFPAANPLFLIPEESSERIYWLIAFPIVSGLVLALGLSPRKSKSKSAEVATVS